MTPSLLALALLVSAVVPRQGEDTEGLLTRLTWRSLGPTSMGGRVIDFAVDPRRKSTFYVATASGGLWKTTTNGTTFRPVFDHESSVSLGDVALAPSNPEIVWVGTGEANARNSVSWGDGVYRSTDGGETWTHRGLRETRHIGAIAIHPENPDVVLVAAVGRTWGPNPERGLFRTEDGGETWQHVIAIDEDTGAIDVKIEPTDPRHVYAATYQRRRDEFDGGNPAVRWGPGSGLWRSQDGGKTFERLTNGLPTVEIGRIGLELWPADSEVLFAIIETELTGQRLPGSDEGLPPYLGVTGEGSDGGYRILTVTEASPAAVAELEEGDLLIRLGEETIGDAAQLREILGAYRSGDEVSAEIQRGDEMLSVTITLGARPGSRGGSFRGSQGGQNAGAQQRQGQRGFETGGVFRSNDRGESWHRINSINPRPFYYSQVRVDPQDDQHLYVLGINLHHSADGGKSFDTRSGRGTHPDHHAMWIDPDDPEHLLLGNDGGVYVTYDRCQTWDFLDRLPIGQFYNVAVDMRRPYHVYGGLQDNGSWGGPSAAPWSSGVLATDWVRIGGGDGFHCAVDPTDPAIVYSESQNGFISRRNLRTGEQQRVRVPGSGHRFNWNTPLFLSPHNPDTLYFAGEEVFRSIDQGRNTVSISQGLNLTRTQRGTATALAESPRVAGLVFVGTDDGAMWMTQDGGRFWERISDHFEGVPAPYYVSDIQPSHHDTQTVYVTLDGHRGDDFAPYVLRSDDLGRSFERLDGSLPEGSVRTLVEDSVNRNLLFLGTEFGCWATLDGGESWIQINHNLPTVAVHDLVLHPRDADLVAGTHGRGIWVLDVNPLRQVTAGVLRREFHLFEVQDAVAWTTMPGDNSMGARRFVSRNPPRGAAIYYYLREARNDSVTLTVKDVLGNPIDILEGPGDAGLHRLQWGLRRQGRRGGDAPPGEYVVTYETEDTQVSRRIRVIADPRVEPVGAAIPARTP